MAALELSGGGRTFGRRGFLAVALGAAAAGCTAPRRRFEGVLAGADDALGHQLRDGFSPPPQRERRVSVAIVGGGVAGLSASWRLLRGGVTDLELVELDTEPGGTARGGANDISRYPWGAHYVPCPLPHARALAALLLEAGAAAPDAEGRLVFDEAQLVRAPQERLHYRGRWIEGLYPRTGASAADLRQLARFRASMERWAAARDGRGRRAFAVPRAHGSDDAEVTALDRLSMHEWLAGAGFDSPRLRWWIEYACRDDFGATLRTTSAWAAIHYFAARQEAGRERELLTWPDGNAHLALHLARALGPRLSLGVAATRLVLRPDGKVAVHTYAPRTGRAEALIADRAIVALPRTFAARLLGEAPPATAPVSAWMVANLTLARRPRSSGAPLAWDNVLFDSPGLGYVVANHQQDPEGCLGPGCTRPPADPAASVWTYYLPFTDDDPAAGRRRLYALGHQELAAAAVADLSRAHPDLADCVTRVDVWRWGHGMVRPVPGLAFSDALRDAARPRGPLHFAHSDLSGLALFEEAQHHGVRAAEEVLAARGVQFESLL